MPNCATEVQETIDMSEPLNSDLDAEIDNETLIKKTVTFSNTLDCMENVQAYFMQQNVNDVLFSSLDKVKKKILSSQEFKR
ncbi:hypothetical protein TNCV_3023811 [Trichonephila clavipes]|nr:hypothetical protein TNCV_3023811 [Trichonephila clavipes]